MPTIPTSRQQRVLDLVEESVRERGYPPSLRELAAALKLSGTRAVEKHLAALEKKGWLRRMPGARALELASRAMGRAVPIVGQVAAGRPILAEENFIGRMTIDTQVARWEDCFLLKVKGQSMRDAGIWDGDMVLVRSQQDAQTGEIVVALLDEEATVKRLMKKDGSLVLKPENPHFEPLVVGPDRDCRILGKVVGVFRFQA
jgi:repressor LexA